MKFGRVKQCKFENGSREKQKFKKWMCPKFKQVFFLNRIKFLNYLKYAKLLASCKSNGPLVLKGTLSALRQFLANKSPLKVMKNAFYFTLTALLLLKIFKFFS